MKIFIKVVPNSKKNEIIKLDNKYKIYISSPAKDGKANLALIEILAKHFSIKKSQIKIVKGQKSREKIAEIIE